MTDSWPHASPRGAGVPRAPRSRTPKKREQLPLDAERTYHRVRQHLFDAPHPKTPRAIAYDLAEDLADVYRALKRLAAAGRARVSGDLWVFIRHAERVAERVADGQ